MRIERAEARRNKILEVMGKKRTGVWHIGAIRRELGIVQASKQVQRDLGRLCREGKLTSTGHGFYTVAA